MQLKNFRVKVITQVLLLFLTLLAVVYVIHLTEFYAAAIVLVLLIITQVYHLIRLMEKSNDMMTQFLQAVRYSDFSQAFAKTVKGKSFDELNQAFAQVMQDFRSIRTEKEEHHRYLQTVVQHVGVGILAFDQDGDIELLNSAAKKLLGVSGMRNISILESTHKGLIEKITSLKSGSQDLIPIQRQDELIHLIVHAKNFQLRGRPLKLISLQNIQSELEEQEIEAWQKLIRVLTHEIMNSITPISSLAKTVDHTLDEIDPDNFNAADLNDIHNAVSTIHRRSEGLIHFVESYRKLTRIPQPNFKMIAVSSLFENVLSLTDVESNRKNINLSSTVVPENLHVIADPELIEQVLLNLIRNALDALAETGAPELSLMSSLDDRGRVVIRVTDNGSGIVKEAQDKIFIPFFTTKKSGSGIGLSLSRQIMRQHGGSINVTSRPDKETTFKLTFP